MSLVSQALFFIFVLITFSGCDTSVEIPAATPVATLDTDLDGIGNLEDPVDDNDGIPDETMICH